MLEHVITKISEYENKLQNNLNNESEFKELNDIFLKYRDNFLTHFDLLDNKYDRFKLINDNLFSKMISYIESLYSIGHRTYAKDIYINKYKNAIKIKYDTPTEYLEDNIILDYCKDLFQLKDHYSKAVIKQKTLINNNNEFLRYKIHHLKNDLLEYQ
ncbi:MAG: hypothetical protein HQL01_11660 [Nitrospirae bacterium]|nr:hypothetical protein [Nitrospirota bacterium]